MQYKQQIQKFNNQIADLTSASEEAWASAMKQYEQYVRGESGKESLRMALDAANNAKAVLAEVSEQKAAYDKKYGIFRKLLSASNKSIPLSEIMDCIDKIVVDTDKKIVVKWYK